MKTSYFGVFGSVRLSLHRLELSGPNIAPLLKREYDDETEQSQSEDQRGESETCWEGDDLLLMSRGMLAHSFGLRGIMV